MVRPAATSPFVLLFATTSFLSAACFDTSSTIATADYPMLLTVDPLLFRGSLRCGAPGLARYVVTLFDVSVAPDDAGERLSLPSSIPVACQNHVSFGACLPPCAEPGSHGVVHQHFYTATIEGYDRDDVAPAALGSRDMLDPSGQLIAPAWITTCGQVPPFTPAADAAANAEADAEIDAAADGSPPYNPLRYPTQVLDKAEVILHGCIPLAPVRTADASVDDGSSGGGDVAGDVEPPQDISPETSDVAQPDGSTPDDDAGGGDGETGDGGDEAGDGGGADAAGDDGGDAGGDAG